MFVGVIVAVILLPSVLLAFWWIRGSKMRKLVNKIPGPPAVPLLGNAHQLKMDGVEFFSQFLNFCKTYSSETGIFRLWFGIRPSIYLTKAETAEVLLTSSKNITKSFFYDFILPWLGTGLLIRITEILMNRFKSPWQWPNFIFDRLSVGVEHKKCIETLHAFTDKVIRERRAEIEERRRAGGSAAAAESLQELTKDDDDEHFGKKPRRRLAFLDLLLQTSFEHPGSLTNDDIREEVNTFMFEGHDTTSAAMNWTVHLVGANPTVQRKLHEELDRVFGDSNRRVTMDDMKELKYLECVIKESLRLFPSVPFFGRSITEDCKIGDFVIPKGATVNIVTPYIHMDPRHFPDPERFDPDRWLPENSVDRHPFAFIAFSAGPRNCIGQKFAMMEEKVILTYIFRKFKVTSMQTREELSPTADLITRPEKGIFVEIDGRQTSAFL